MPCKIFLSFLGAGVYAPASYYWADKGIDDNPVQAFYVQEAVLNQIHVEKALVFTTAGARANNYHNRLVRGEGGNYELMGNEGLESRLKALKSKGQVSDFQSVDIPEGYTEAEIWRIFQLVFEHINEGDQVYLDVTYGFRSLPLLAIVLLNYARVLKGIEVKGIFYGNFEAGKAAKASALANASTQAEKETAEQLPIEAPIFNLLAFVNLQDWVQAASAFEKGDMNDLQKLLGQPHPDLAHDLSIFSESIRASRGLEVGRDIDFNGMKQRVVRLGEDSSLEVQLKPLLKKISEKLSGFDSYQLRNGFSAVEWCIQHNMIQQGITFLQETIVSLVIEQMSRVSMVTDLVYRTAANGALHGYSNAYLALKKRDEHDLPLADEDIIELQLEMKQWVDSVNGLSRLYKRLSGDFRNDVNHCGFREDYKSAEELKNELAAIYTSIKALNL